MESVPEFCDYTYVHSASEFIESVAGCSLKLSKLSHDEPHADTNDPTTSCQDLH
jgi:hypothetical protein